MKLDALDHPKTLDFAARLGVSRPTAIGHLELFWHFVSKQAPQGNVGKFPDGAIARAADWDGDPDVFLKSLLKSGFLDESEEHRYLVHDWPEHCPNWVRAQLSKLHRPFYVVDSRSYEGTEERSYERSLSPSTRARVPREGKGREGKPSHTKGGEAAPESVDNSNGSEPGLEVSSGESSPQKEPLSRRARNGSQPRHLGDFEAINDTVEQLVTGFQIPVTETKRLAQAAHVSEAQVAIAIRQLRDRGRLPPEAA